MVKPTRCPGRSQLSLRRMGLPKRTALTLKCYSNPFGPGLARRRRFFHFLDYLWVKGLTEEPVDPLMALKPYLGEKDALLPPLPTIHDREILGKVFTHRSYFARPTRIFEDHPDDPSPDNEKLEHLGDSVLGFAVTHLMLEMYPSLHVGPSTKMRALIVGNATLADISVKYKLPDRLRLHPAQALTLKASANIQADVFESFVGGLFCDQGMQAVESWLFKLFRPYSEHAYGIVRQQHGLTLRPPPPSSIGGTNKSVISPPSTPSTPTAPTRMPLSRTDLNIESLTITATGHLGLFNQRLQKANRQVEWIYSLKDPDEVEDDAVIDPEMVRGSKTTPVWYVSVMVDGEYFGRGKGITKKIARNEAAKEGLKKLES